MENIVSDKGLNGEEEGGNEQTKALESDEDSSETKVK